MGAGFGVMLIGSMVVISRWFPPDRFSTLVAMVLSIGLLGNLLATTPLAWASEAIGWRGVFGVVGRLHRARRHRGLAGGARRAARPSVPGPHPGAAARDAARPDRGAAQSAAAADPGAEFLQLRLHLHRAGPVGRPVPARGAWHEPDRGRQRAAGRRDRLPARHAQPSARWTACSTRANGSRSAAPW